MDAHLGLLAHDLPVHLAARRHVDDDVRFDGAPNRTGAGRRRSELRLAKRRSGSLNRDRLALDEDHPVLRELALGDQHLASPAEPAAAADRIDVHAEGARRLEDRRADWEAPALAGRGEDDRAGSRGSWVARSAQAGRRRWPPSRRPRPAPSAGGAVPAGGASRYSA